MEKQQMFYESAVPLMADRHRDWYLDATNDFSFAKNINSAPVTAAEFPFAAQDYALVFAGDDDALMPAAIFGIRNNENCFINDQGQWDAKYVPAFIRRYPFVFSSSSDGNTLTLCIDEKFPGINQEQRGARLFDDEGKPTPQIENVLKFLQEFQVQFARTREFCKKLKELDILEPMRADMVTPAGEKLALVGFQAVNRERLKALSAEQLAEQVKNDGLELIYLHLHSMRHFSQERFQK